MKSSKNNNNEVLDLSLSLKNIAKMNFPICTHD